MQLFTSFSTSTPQFNYDLDRTKAKLLGLSLPDVFNTLQIYLGSLYVNDFNLFGRTFRVTLQADNDTRAAATDLSRLYVRNATGGMVPLSTLGSLQPIVGPGDRAALQQLRVRPDQRRPGAGLQLRPGGRGDGTRRGDRTAARLRLRMDRHHLSGAESRLDRHRRLHPGDRLRLSDPCRTVRELVDAVHGAVRGAARAVRRVPRAVPARHADRRLFADRVRDADRAVGEERDFDRRVRQTSPIGGSRHRRGGDGGRRDCGCARF